MTDQVTDNGLDFLSGLMAHVAKVVAKPEVEKQLASSKRAAANKTLPDAERLAAMAAAARLQAELITISWTAKANVAFFRKTECQCGMIDYTFQRFMQRIVSNTKPHVERWASGLDLNNDLPKEDIYQAMPKTSICGHCAHEHGFSTSTATLVHKESFHATAS
jgi:hypothetical protein